MITLMLMLRLLRLLPFLVGGHCQLALENLALRQQLDVYERTMADKDAPDGRPIEPPALGAIIPVPEVGGLHHRYVRRAAGRRD